VARAGHAAPSGDRPSSRAVRAARDLAQSFFACPAPGEPRRALSARVACRNKWKRIESLQRLKDFELACREALDAWRTGVRDVLFPPGTYLLRLTHGARCAPAG